MCYSPLEIEEDCIVTLASKDEEKYIFTGEAATIVVEGHIIYNSVCILLLHKDDIEISLKNANEMNVIMSLSEL